MDLFKMLGIKNSGGFLDSLFNPIMNAAGNQITQALFGRQDRISNRDFQFYQDLADSGNPREIARQSEFLEGLAPSQAAAYNTYQDATYAADTQRQADRVKTMSSELGMSPWEVTGASGAAPLPSPTIGQSPGNGSGSAGQILQNLTPLLTAKMAQDTALATTKMNNETALQSVQMQTDTQRYGTDVGAATQLKINDINTANGRLPIAQLSETQQRTLATEAQTFLTRAQELKTQAETLNVPLQGKNIEADTYLKGVSAANVQQQTAESITRQTVMQDEVMLKSIGTMMSLVPERTIGGMGFTEKERIGWQRIIRIMSNQGTSQGVAQEVANFLGEMDDGKYNSTMRTLQDVAQAAQEQFGESAAKFMRGLTLEKAREHFFPQ